MYRPAHVKPDGLSGLRGEVDLIHIPSAEAPSDCQLLEKEKLLFSSVVSLGIQATLKVSLHSQQEIANTK